MLTVISPPNLDWDPVDITPTPPEFQADAVRLAKTSRNLTLGSLKDLMSISDDLARLNRDRFKAFEEAPAAQRTKPAVFAFNGDTYQGFEAKTLGPGDLLMRKINFAFSVGYTASSAPLDAIQPYRLEMGSRLKTRRGKSLYDYWGDTLAKALNALGAEQGTDTVVNCASQEYFGAADTKALTLRVVHPVFMEVKDNKPRIVSFFAKKARGAMARYMVENRLKDINALKEFNVGGYQYDPNLSEGDAKLTFVREYPTVK